MADIPKLDDDQLQSIQYMNNMASYIALKNTKLQQDRDNFIFNNVNPQSAQMQQSTSTGRSGGWGDGGTGQSGILSQKSGGFDITDLPLRQIFDQAKKLSPSGVGNPPVEPAGFEGWGGADYLGGSPAQYIPIEGAGYAPVPEAGFGAWGGADYLAGALPYTAVEGAGFAAVPTAGFGAWGGADYLAGTAVGAGAESGAMGGALGGLGAGAGALAVPAFVGAMMLNQAINGGLPDTLSTYYLENAYSPTWEAGKGLSPGTFQGVFEGYDPRNPFSLREENYTDSWYGDIYRKYLEGRNQIVTDINKQALDYSGTLDPEKKAAFEDALAKQNWVMADVGMQSLGEQEQAYEQLPNQLQYIRNEYSNILNHIMQNNSPLARSNAYQKPQLLSDEQAFTLSGGHMRDYEGAVPVIPEWQQGWSSGY